MTNAPRAIAPPSPTLIPRTNYVTHVPAPRRDNPLSSGHFCSCTRSGAKRAMLIIFDHTSTAIRGTLPDTPPASTRRLLVLLKASGREGQGAGAGVNGPFWAQMAPPRRRINVPLEAKNPATQVKRSAHPDSSRNLPHHNPPNQRSNPPTSCHSAPSTIHLSTAPRRGIKKYTRKSSDTSTPWLDQALPEPTNNDTLTEHQRNLRNRPTSCTEQRTPDSPSPAAILRPNRQSLPGDAR